MADDNRHAGQAPNKRNETLVAWTAKVVAVIAISLSLYQLYTAGIAALTALVQRSIHLGAILALTFLLRPAFRGARKDRFSIWLLIDGLLVLTAIACTGYICVNLTAIFERQGDWLPADLVVSVVGTLLVLEACRRVIGLFMSAICIIGILYAIYGPYMPDLIIHKGYSIERIATTLWLTTEGISDCPSAWRLPSSSSSSSSGPFWRPPGGATFSSTWPMLSPAGSPGGRPRPRWWPRAFWGPYPARQWATWRPPVRSPFR